MGTRKGVVDLTVAIAGAALIGVGGWLLLRGGKSPDVARGNTVPGGGDGQQPAPIPGIPAEPVPNNPKGFLVPPGGSVAVIGDGHAAVLAGLLSSRFETANLGQHAVYVPSPGPLGGAGTIVTFQPPSASQLKGFDSILVVLGMEEAADAVFGTEIGKKAALASMIRIAKDLEATGRPVAFAIPLNASTDIGKGPMAWAEGAPGVLSAIRGAAFAAKDGRQLTIEVPQKLLTEGDSFFDRAGDSVFAGPTQPKMNGYEIWANVLANALQTTHLFA